jgi:hypothetical protein
MDYATGAAGLRAGISLAAANTVMMPLTPRLLVALGPGTAATKAPKELIGAINHHQTRGGLFSALTCYGNFTIASARLNER